MNYVDINYLAHEKIRDLQGERRDTTYAFQPNFKKTIARAFYKLASSLEPKAYPPRKLA